MSRKTQISSTIDADLANRIQVLADERRLKEKRRVSFSEMLEKVAEIGTAKLEKK